MPVPADLIADGPVAPWHPSALIVAHGKLSKRAKAAWTWWRLPSPPLRNTAFSDLIEETPTGVAWRTRRVAKDARREAKHFAATARREAALAKAKVT